MSSFDMTGGNGSCSTDSWDMWQEQVWKVSMPLLCLVELPFAWYFSRKLIASTRDRGGLTDKRNRLAVAVLCYNLNVTATFLLIGWQEIGSPILQNLRGGDFSIEGCALSTFLSITAATLSYLTLVEVLVLRLSVAFRHTAYEVRKETLQWFQASLVLALVFGLIGYTLRAAFTSCKRIRFTGYLRDVGLAQRTYKYCAVPEQLEWLAGAVVVLGLTYVFCADVVLGWLFLSRLRHLSENSAGSVAASQQFGSVMERASVIALASIATTVTALTMAAISGLNLFFELDLLLNMVFLYSMFSFSDLYDRLFGPMLWFIRRHRTKLTSVGSRSPRTDDSPHRGLAKIKSATAMSLSAEGHSPSADASLSRSLSCDLKATPQKSSAMVSVRSHSDVTVDTKTLSSGTLVESPALQIMDVPSFEQ